MRACVGVLLAGVAATLAAACFDFDATTAGGSAPDAATAPGDATVDGSTADVAVGDSGGGGRPDGGSYCASLPHDAGIFFCDDFDERPLPGSWNEWREVGGSIDETDASWVSPPHAIDEVTQVLDAGQPVDVSLRTPLGVPAVPATLRFGFEVEPVQTDPTANAAIVLGAVDFLDGAGNRYTVDLAIDVVSGFPALTLDEQSGFADGGASYVRHPLPPTKPLPVNAWTDLVLEIDWTAPGTAEGLVMVDGAKEADVSLTMTVAPASLQIGVGTPYVSEPAPVWELRYDNVRFIAM